MCKVSDWLASAVAQRMTAIGNGSLVGIYGWSITDISPEVAGVGYPEGYSVVMVTGFGESRCAFDVAIRWYKTITPPDRIIEEIRRNLESR